MDELVRTKLEVIPRHFIDFEKCAEHTLIRQQLKATLEPCLNAR
jgi:hypothetical protein